jgi:magnesium chelatase family protein
VALARERGLQTVYVPAIDAREATLLGGVTIMPVPTLGALVAHLRGELPWLTEIHPCIYLLG